MKESERRIKKYKSWLPQIRQKIVAATSILIMSAVVMTSTTFAWLTLSRAPEVSGAKTQIASNGNLEIALSEVDGSAPGASTTTDGSKSITERNKTWGNIINLSDSSYGLDNIMLRPALLNQADLKNSPLQTFSYAEDGRIEALESDFSYCTYDVGSDTYYATNSRYGVRAVASVTYREGEENAAKKQYNAVAKQAIANIGSALTSYNSLVSNGDNQTVLSNLMNAYLQARLNDKDVSVNSYLGSLKMMLEEFNAILDYCIEASLDFIELRQLAKYGANDVLNQRYTRFDEEKLFECITVTANSYNELTKVTVKGDLWTVFNDLYSSATVSDPANQPENFLVVVGQMKKDREVIVNQLNALQTLINMKDAGETIYWYGADASKLNTCDIAKIVNAIVDINTTTLNGTPIGSSGQELMSAAGAGGEVIIYHGALERMEQRTGGRASMGVNLKVQVSFISIPVKANITTDATLTTLSSCSTFFSDKAPSEFDKGTPIAQDCYALAIDFFVRTNAEGSYLLLQDKETNRIWGDDPVLPEQSTSQGQGSCYTFFTEDPIEQQTILETISAIRVAFVDVNGSLLALGMLDTKEAVSEYGKVTVPLTYDTTEKKNNKGSAENPYYAITPLRKNEETRITAIFYISGGLIENDNVLSNSSIQGNINLQFASSVDLLSKDDEDLRNEEIRVSAAVQGRTEFNYDTDTDLTAGVKVNIEGLTPTTVTGSFIRMIGSTQGLRMPTFTFTSDGETSWVGNFTFNSPGTYVLRSVTINGSEYTFAEPIRIEVTGFGIQTIYWSESSTNAQVLLTDNRYTTDVTVKYAGDATNKAPTSVTAVFMNEEGDSATASLTPSDANKTWKGSVTFNTSGRYTWKYIVENENYTSVENYGIKLSLTLGMTARIYVDGATTIALSDECQNPSFSMKVALFNDRQEELQSLSGLAIRYVRRGSSVVDNGSYTALTWNTDQLYYTGAINISSAGIFDFYHITIQNGYNTYTLTNTQGEVPTLTVLAAGVATFISDDSNETQYLLQDSEVNINIKFLNASGAQNVYALIERENEGAVTQIVVKGNYNGNYWRFPLQEKGNYQVVSVAMDNVSYMKNDEVETLETATTPLTESNFNDCNEYCYFNLRSQSKNVNVIPLDNVEVALTGGGIDKSYNVDYYETLVISEPLKAVFSADGIDHSLIANDIMTVVYTYDNTVTDIGTGYTIDGALSAQSVSATLTWNENEGAFVCNEWVRLGQPGAYSVKIKYTIAGNPVEIAQGSVTVKYNPLIQEVKTTNAAPASIAPGLLNINAGRALSVTIKNAGENGSYVPAERFTSVSFSVVRKSNATDNYTLSGTFGQTSYTLKRVGDAYVTDSAIMVPSGVYTVTASIQLNSQIIYDFDTASEEITVSYLAPKVKAELKDNTYENVPAGENCTLQSGDGSVSATAGSNFTVTGGQVVLKRTDNAGDGYKKTSEKVVTNTLAIQNAGIAGAIKYSGVYQVESVTVKNIKIANEYSYSYDGETSVDKAESSGSLTVKWAKPGSNVVSVKFTGTNKTGKFIANDGKFDKAYDSEYNTDLKQGNNTHKGRKNTSFAFVYLEKENSVLDDSVIVYREAEYKEQYYIDKNGYSTAEKTYRFHEQETVACIPVDYYWYQSYKKCTGYTPSTVTMTMTPTVKPEAKAEWKIGNAKLVFTNGLTYTFADAEKANTQTIDLVTAGLYKVTSKTLEINNVSFTKDGIEFDAPNAVINTSDYTIENPY